MPANLCNQALTTKPWFLFCDVKWSEILPLLLFCTGVVFPWVYSPLFLKSSKYYPLLRPQAPSVMCHCSWQLFKERCSLARNCSFGGEAYDLPVCSESHAIKNYSTSWLSPIAFSYYCWYQLTQLITGMSSYISCSKWASFNTSCGCVRVHTCMCVL